MERGFRRPRQLDGSDALGVVTQALASGLKIGAGAGRLRRGRLRSRPLRARARRGQQAESGPPVDFHIVIIAYGAGRQPGEFAAGERGSARKHAELTWRPEPPARPFP